MRHFFSDVDGTLLQNHSVSPSTIAKIKEFVSKGNKFYYATGRVDADIKLLEEKISIYADYRISQNGAVIKNRENKTVYSKVLSKNIIPQLVDYLYAIKGVTIEVTTVDDRYSNSERKISHNYEFTAPVIIDKNIIQKIVNLDCTLFLILSDDYKILAEAQKKINIMFPEYAYAIETSPGCMEVLPLGASKGTAIEFLQQKYKLDNRSIIVAGDSYNDVSMFNKYHENSFVMSGAPIAVKQQAKNVVDNVGQVIESFS